MGSELRPHRLDVTPLGATPLVATPLPFFGPFRIPTRVRPREAGWNRALSRVLNAGTWTSCGLFAASLVLEAVPATLHASVAIDFFRKSGASLLLATPVVGLVGAGGALAARGEYRYAALAAGVLGLLALALGLRFTV